MEALRGRGRRGRGDFDSTRSSNDGVKWGRRPGGKVVGWSRGGELGVQGRGKRQRKDEAPR
jgi:hypothetical protein